MKTLFLISLSLFFISPVRCLADKIDFSIQIDNRSTLKVNMYFQNSVYQIGPRKIVNISTKVNSDEFPASLVLSSSTNPNGFISPGDIFQRIRVYSKKVNNRQIIIDSNKNIFFYSNPSEKGMEYFETRMHQKLFWPFTDSVLNKNRNDIFSADIINNYLCSNRFPTDSVQFYYNHLSSAIKKTPTGKSILNYIIGKHHLQVGNQVKDFSLMDTNSNQTALFSIKSDYILLDFWFIRCGPCLESFPDLLELYKSSDRSRIQIIGISIDKIKDFSKWKECINSHALSWPNLIDTGSTVSFKTFSITSYPTTIMLDKNYRIIKINPSLTEIKKIIN